MHYARDCSCTYIQHIQSDIENCEGWLSPGGHSSGGRALTAKVRGPRFNPKFMAAGFLQFSKNFPKPFNHVHVHVHMHMYWYVVLCNIYMYMYCVSVYSTL